MYVRLVLYMYVLYRGNRIEYQYYYYYNYNIIKIVYVYVLLNDYYFLF